MNEVRDRDVKALADFWRIFWSALVLNPRGLQSVRGTMAKLGLVKQRGPLALTAMGERVIAFSNAGHRQRARRK